MLVFPKWQTMWLESQHCSKDIMNVPLAPQQSKKVLEDLRTNCCSPNKLVQLEALKCWGLWINSQNPDDLKLNTVCFTAVRPLLIKKMQPLYKDADICKLKLSLMWALLVKVQNIMQLEGPQYILEAFLQSCLFWLSSAGGDVPENEVSLLIFQLLLSILNKNEGVSQPDGEMFTPLTSDILSLKKVFHQLSDKFLSIFVYWRKVPDRNMFLKLWKQFLEHCELSCDHIPIPLWHKVFKLADQICSEKNEPIKERLAFLHSCATTLKSVLSSSKFIDFGNLLTTPCEALLKKLVELCTTKSTPFCDLDMFLYSKEICQTLSDKSVAIGGFDLCVHVLDVLEEFWLKDLLWGVWCGLVCCYKIHLQHLDKNQFTEIEMKFYRKLRGIAVNFELDREVLHKDCIKEVEKHIELLNINWFSTSNSENSKDTRTTEKELVALKAKEIVPSERILRASAPRGSFSSVSVCKRTKFLPKTSNNVKIDLIKNILKNIDANSMKSLFNYLLSFQFTKGGQPMGKLPFSCSLQLKMDNKEDMKVTLSCLRSKTPTTVPESTPVKKNAVVLYDRHRKTQTDEEEPEEEEKEEVISTPKTRSRKRAEEMKKEIENQKRKKRKSFEVIVQEIVRKNKERKTEKNSRRKSPISLKGKRNKKKIEKSSKVATKEEKLEVSERKLRNTKKEEVKTEKKKGKKSFKTDGKLENYFKVITKKSGSEAKKEEKKPRKGKKSKDGKRENTCCNTEIEESGERKGEIGWRQTSLKTMMNRKNKGDKTKTEMRGRNKNSDEEKVKVKKGSKTMGSPLSKLSPFKEVFHDHEYAKIEPQQLQTFERVLLLKQERSSEVETIKQTEKSGEEEATIKDNEIPQKSVDVPEQNITELPTVEIRNSQTEPLGDENKEMEELQTPGKPEEESEKPKSPPPLETVSDAEINPTGSTNVDDADELPEEKTADVEPAIILDESAEDLTPSKKGRKRMRMLDSLKPSKKIKLEEEELPEEKLPLEITEKENLEEKQLKTSSPTKKEKTGSCLLVKSEESPVGVKTGNGMISSRALRMIALVPESTKGSQMQWESTPRPEVLKCKKAPNVDKYSRASKMLALLSENVTESEEDVTMEEIDRKGLGGTPNMKTPISSLKSPKSIKKRRSIRFDDAKNETVLYQTDTPPSQILEEKEKRRRFKPAEL